MYIYIYIYIGMSSAPWCEDGRGCLRRARAHAGGENGRPPLRLLALVVGIIIMIINSNNR